MKRFAEQLNKKSQSVKMTAAERRELKARLVSYMEYHPLPKTTQQKNAERYLEAESAFSFIHFNTPHFRGFSAMFAAFLLIMVPVIAEKSVPGDVLYPVKVHFTEEIRSTLTVSPYAKIELETRLLERRIAEARLLASEGKLTAEVEEEVAAAVKTHSDAAQEGIAVLRETDSDEAAIAEIALGSALSVQSEVLEGTLEKAAEATGETTTEETPVNALAMVVEEARKDVEENQSQQTPSFEKLMARMEQDTTRAYELFDDVKSAATAEEVADVERRLSDIERKLEEAVAINTTVASTTDQSDTAPRDVALLRTALSDLQKLISFMTDIDVREYVTVEELVPVTLTDEEVRASLVATQKETGERLETAREAFATYEGEMDEKIEMGLIRVAELASSSKAALLEDSLSAAEQALAEATAYISDIEKLLGEVTEATESAEDESAQVGGEDGLEEEGEAETEENEEVIEGDGDVSETVVEPTEADMEEVTAPEAAN